MRRSWGGMRGESGLEKKKNRIKISAQHRALRERERANKIDGWDDRHLAGLWERRTFHREHVWEGRDSGGGRWGRGKEREKGRERSHTNSEANWSIPLLRSTEPCSSFHPEPKTHTHTHATKYTLSLQLIPSFLQNELKKKKRKGRVRRQEGIWETKIGMMLLDWLVQEKFNVKRVKTGLKKQ